MPLIKECVSISSSSARDVTSVDMRLLYILLTVFLVRSECRRRRSRLSATTTERTVLRDSICELKDAYYPMVGQCDAYFECRNWKAKVKFCPEGLRFQPGIPHSQFPCLYPAEVSCEGRELVQKWEPTDDCPHLNGYFSSDSEDCGAFKNCVDGKAYKLHCPEGLAYNEVSYRCDWPENVRTCNVETFLGFKCPGLLSEDDLAATVNYAYPSDCSKYYSCVKGTPRILTCPTGEIFDENKGVCSKEHDVVCVMV